MTVEEAVGDAAAGARHEVGGGARGPRSSTRSSGSGSRRSSCSSTKYPRDLSGGQKQRVVHRPGDHHGPRACWWPTSRSRCSTCSVRAKILQLMLDLKQDLGLTYVYITHDLASAKYFCDRIAIMYLGRIVEIGPTEEIFANPRHPYTKALLAAIPDPDPGRMRRRATCRAARSPTRPTPPLGCAFHPRCPEATPICGWESRDLRALVEEHWTRRPPEEYDAERALGRRPRPPRRGGDRGHPRQRQTRRRRTCPGSRMRAEDPDEPLWRGVDAIDGRRRRACAALPRRRGPGAAPRRRRRGGLRALPGP